ncbi:MAG: biotin transporter BioY [Gemmatimonadetes bacterium]|jgi:biotin transport system substrate-specific component|nr:biotin transporter BioY [Gemmatimonadota bacterium]MBA3968576.1 biotin transporter BioY [Gemmatimonadota bacterium]MDQ3308643.1 biotin transporter BioY [Gemmatimonadota bacterium]
MRASAATWTGAELVPSRTARRAIGVLAFAVATALGARIALPIPGTPIPFTLQPMFVLLAGALLGSRLGALSQTLYLFAGAVGLPIFVAGGGFAYLLGPTGGYLLAYPLAAWLAGTGARQGAGRMLAGLLAGLAAIYVGGLAWLSIVGTASMAVAWGLRPFLLADLVKTLLVLLIGQRLRERAAHLFGG